VARGFDCLLLLLLQKAEEDTLFFDPELFVDTEWVARCELSACTCMMHSLMHACVHCSYKEMAYEIDDFVQPVYALNAASVRSCTPQLAPWK
jgi:hypothetical protein